MSASLVSLVTPAYNQARFLPATLDSVLAQTHPAIDYRVIDDGSTDDTPAVLARYADRVRWERQENMGQARTLNRAWETARGRYLSYLSSDDLLAPEALARAVAVLDREPGVVCVFPQADSIDPDGRVIKRAVCRPFDLADTLVTQDCWIGPGAVWRADAHRAVGGWRPELRLAPDREYWIRLASHGRIALLPETLAGYRMHPGAISHREVSEAQSREYLLVLDEYFARGDVPPDVSARRAEAYARANLLVARNRLRAGDWRTARRYYAHAARLHPPLAGPRTWLSLARTTAGRPLRLAQARLRRAAAR